MDGRHLGTPGKHGCDSTTWDPPPLKGTGKSMFMVEPDKGEDESKKWIYISTGNMPRARPRLVRRDVRMGVHRQEREGAYKASLRSEDGHEGMGIGEGMMKSPRRLPRLITPIHISARIRSSNSHHTSHG